MKFEIWHYWVIAAFFFFLLEVFVPGFILGSIGLGCLLAMTGALFNLPLWFCAILFIAGFFVGITMLKPLLNRMEKLNEVKTNVDGLIGRTGKVIERIDQDSGYGRVMVDGDDWKAVSYSHDSIEKGTIVEIVAIESIVITVRPLAKNNTQAEISADEKPIADTLKNNLGLIVTRGNKKEVVHFENIFCIYSNQKTTYLVTSGGKEMVLDESLEKLEERLDPKKFFRANRQFIITPRVVKEFKTKDEGKLEIALNALSNLPSCISVSRLKAHAFRKWFEKQV
ncbi:MAG: LytTR family transcriptional regulator DNA-binding domain-containing protein [Prolixibacteraceae bacterium]|nr:LytTR family transcriptional regulator DNA-binding domain-containing protein [Prolixibacteraceae bacterium]